MLSPARSFRIPLARREGPFSISKASASPPLPPLRKGESDRWPLFSQLVREILTDGQCLDALIGRVGHADLDLDAPQRRRVGRRVRRIDRRRVRRTRREVTRRARWRGSPPCPGPGCTRWTRNPRPAASGPPPGCHRRCCRCSVVERRRSSPPPRPELGVEEVVIDQGRHPPLVGEGLVEQVELGVVDVRIGRGDVVPLISIIVASQVGGCQLSYPGTAVRAGGSTAGRLPSPGRRRRRGCCRRP